MSELLDRMRALLDEVEDEAPTGPPAELLRGELQATRKGLSDLRYDMDDMRKEMKEAVDLLKLLRRKELKSNK